MLILSRRVGEKIVVPECGLSVTVVAVKGNTIRLGLSAPADVEIHRAEIWRPGGRRPATVSAIREEAVG